MKVVLITGVAGGIGNATATIFSEAGWCVVGVDRQEKQKLSGVKRFLHRDISRPGTSKEIAQDIAANEGQLDAIVNNAAMLICKPLLDTTIEEWDNIMACNVRAPFLLVRDAYPLLRMNGGSIVNICSVHAVATSLQIAAYAASKGAMVALTRAMALEFAPDGVRVNAVLPGAVDTQMLRSGFDRGHISGKGPDELLSELDKKHPLGRVGKPEEIGRAILFLADNEQSSFMTGQTMIVDGGALARLSTE